MSITVEPHRKKTFSRFKAPNRPPSFYDHQKTDYTILCPQMSPIHFALLGDTFEKEGIKLVVLPEVDHDAVEQGLRYVNNDACYPAIVVVGQLIQALKSGRFDPERTALLISQTCGGCRSTNYLTFLKIAVQKAGFPKTPVIPFNVTMSGDKAAEGIHMDIPMLKTLLVVFLFGDLLMRLSNHCRPYESQPGSTDILLDSWIGKLKPYLAHKSKINIPRLAEQIVRDFDALELVEENSKPKVGIVGEILLKYHQGANRHLVSLIEKEGGEAVVPDILDFVLYCMSSDMLKSEYMHVPFRARMKSAFLTWLVEHYRNKVRKVLKKSRRFSPMEHISHLVKKARTLVSTGNQTGEGWLLAADMVEFVENGVPNIVCVQPFGCLPNHITGKGVIKELRSRHPLSNITPIDFDPGTTEVNQLNRIKLMMAVAMKNMKKQDEC